MIGEKEMFLAFIAKGDHDKVARVKYLFNELVLHTGGMPLKNGDLDTTRFCAGVAFPSKRCLDDFLYEMQHTFGVWPVTYGELVWADRRQLPHPSSIRHTPAFIT